MQDAEYRPAPVQLAPSAPSGEGANAHVALDLAALDGARGVAALVVVIGHLLTFFVPHARPGQDLPPGQAPPPPAAGFPPAPPIFTDGTSRWPVFGLEYLSAVSLFFVVSGFSLVAVYEVPLKHSSEAPPLSTPEQRRVFFRRRVARLAPVYYLGLLVAVVPFVVYNDALALGIGFPISLLGLQSIFLFDCQNWDGPLWTVSAFCVCYACFPRLLCRMRHLTPGRLTMAIWTCAGLSALPAAVLLTGGTLSYAWVLHFFAIFRLPQFAMGVAAGLLAQRRPLRRPRLTAEALSLVLAANIAFCAGLTAAVVPRISGYIWLLYSHHVEFYIVVVHCYWIMALTTPRAAGGGGPTARVLSSFPLRALGDVSYALYCLHFPVIQWLAWAVAHAGISASAVPFSFPTLTGGFYSFPTWGIGPLVAACLLVATAAHVALERPARRAIAKPRERKDAGASAGLLAEEAQLPEVPEQAPSA